MEMARQKLLKEAAYDERLTWGQGVRAVGTGGGKVSPSPISKT